MEGIPHLKWNVWSTGKEQYTGLKKEAAFTSQGF